MKLAICSGPATTGKTAVIRQMIRRLIQGGDKVAYAKVDVQYADEDVMLAEEFGIPTTKFFSEDMCPDHYNVMVLPDAITFARDNGAEFLFVETAGLCLRCSPYVDSGLGMIVIEATSGTNLPLKIGPLLTLSDVAVVTKIDRVSQAEKEVFRSHIQKVDPEVSIREVNALYGIGIDPLVKMFREFMDLQDRMQLRGILPLGECDLCIGRMGALKKTPSLKIY